MMSNKQKYFEYYCDDNLTPPEEMIQVTYNIGGQLRRCNYTTGIQCKIKKAECYILYNPDDLNFETDVTYIPVSMFKEQQEELYLKTISEEEYQSIFKKIKEINIFELLSFLDFTSIFGEFKKLIDNHWEETGLESLIEM